MRNTYFILRHGETIYQREKKKRIYFWPDSSPPVSLTKRGEKQIRTVAKKLKKEKIDLIYSSDVYRTRQTAEIIRKEIGIQKVYFDKRLRDINLGIYQGKFKKEVHRNFPNPIERFNKGPKKGESWNDIKKRLLNFLKGIDKKYRNKRILIISHGDPLWLLEGIVKGLSNQELLDEIFVKKNYISVGELRKLN